MSGFFFITIKYGVIIYFRAKIKLIMRDCTLSKNVLSYQKATKTATCTLKVKLMVVVRIRILFPDMKFVPVSHGDAQAWVPTHAFTNIDWRAIGQELPRREGLRLYDLVWSKVLREKIPVTLLNEGEIEEGYVRFIVV